MQIVLQYFYVSERTVSRGLDFVALSKSHLHSPSIFCCIKLQDIFLLKGDACVIFTFKRSLCILTYAFSVMTQTLGIFFNFSCSHFKNRCMTLNIFHFSKVYHKPTNVQISDVRCAFSHKNLITCETSTLSV